MSIISQQLTDDYHLIKKCPSLTPPTSLWARNGSPSTSHTSPQHAANRGRLFKPELQTNMARGKNGRYHFLHWGAI